MPTPRWTYNRLIRNINDIESVMAILSQDSAEYKKLKSVTQSLTGLAVMFKKEKNNDR